MSKIKLLLEVVSDLRSLANSLQAVADAVRTGRAGTAGPNHGGKAGSETGKENCRKERGVAYREGRAAIKTVDAGTGACGSGGEVPRRTHIGSKGAPDQAWCR